MFANLFGILEIFVQLPVSPYVHENDIIKLIYMFSICQVYNDNFFSPVKHM